MSISSHQIHSVLRTYSKQLKRGQRLNRVKQTEGNSAADKIQISAEAKRLRVVEKVASEILGRMAENGGNGGEVEKGLVDKLSQDYGQELSLTYNREAGNFSFHVVSTEQDSETLELDAEETERLNNQLSEIAKDFVDRTMLRGEA